MAVGDPDLLKKIARHTPCPSEASAAASNREVGLDNPSLASDLNFSGWPILDLAVNAIGSGQGCSGYGIAGIAGLSLPPGAHAVSFGRPGGAPGGEAAAMSTLWLRGVVDIGGGRLCLLWKQLGTVAVHQCTVELECRYVMKKIIRGAIGPALIVAVLQCVLELASLLAALVQPFKQQFLMGFIVMVFTQMTLLIGAAAYAGLLRRRSKASLSGCAVGGATVGLLANLASQAVKGVLLGLAVILVLDGAARAVVLIIIFLSCVLAGVGGLVLGEIGGGAVGLLSLRRSPQ
jgi:hypothetical protein